jgi:hypothetical protein
MAGVLHIFPHRPPHGQEIFPDAGYRPAGFTTEWFRDLGDGSNSAKKNIVHDYPAGNYPYVS